MKSDISGHPKNNVLKKNLKVNEVDLPALHQHKTTATVTIDTKVYFSLKVQTLIQVRIYAKC